MEKKIRLTIIDDHQLLRDGLVALFKPYGQFVISQASNGQEFLNLLQCELPDVILMDIRMPEMGGHETIGHLTKYYSSIKIIVLTSYDEPEIAFHMVQKGAHAYLDKNTGIDTIIEAIHAVLRPPGYFFNKYLGEDTLSQIMEAKAKHTKATFFKDREEKILDLVSNQYSNKQIAARLGISESTVERCRAEIMKKTGRCNSAGLAAYNIQRNIWIRYWFKSKKR